MSRRTSFDELYSMIGTVLNRATGRVWWRKAGIQAQPKGPYATLYLAAGQGLQNPVTETVLLEEPDGEGHVFEQIPWGTLHIECQAEFFRSGSNDSAIQAAVRFANALRLEERYWDLWGICGMSGACAVLDISGMFRADVEPRARATFHVYANVADSPLLDTKIYDIKRQPITVTREDDEGITFTVLDTGEIVWPTT